MSECTITFRPAFLPGIRLYQATGIFGSVMFNPTRHMFYGRALYECYDGNDIARFETMDDVRKWISEKIGAEIKTLHVKGLGV